MKGPDHGGEIFVLNMGASVKIIDMAKSLIMLSGLEPGRDIEIKVTGLKPGEKMHEELMEDPAGHDSSSHPDIMVLRGENKPLENLEERLLDLELTVRKAPVKALVTKLRELAPTFAPHEAHGVLPQAVRADRRSVGRGGPERFSGAALQAVL